ncbi:hypothetical protein VTP01DRAFT_9477 [Rhizomucor pusillus]|uniref:uncharacterized protein n=1 Tax=Rhizomucor pusillus TaxID=4840 RepID=UPI0037431DA0
MMRGFISLDAQVDFFEDQRLDDIPSCMTDQIEHEYAAKITSEGYSLLLNPNQYNSCYIDAPLELLWHSIMPIISIIGSAHTPFADNTFASILWGTYEMSKSRTSRIHALQRFRNFVWASENRFEKGRKSDVLSLSEYLLDNMSEEFKEKLYFRKGTCNNVPARCQAFEIYRAKTMILHQNESIDQQFDLGRYTSL